MMSIERGEIRRVHAATLRIGTSMLRAIGKTKTLGLDPTGLLDHFHPSMQGKSNPVSAYYAKSRQISDRRPVLA